MNRELNWKRIIHEAGFPEDFVPHPSQVAYVEAIYAPCRPGDALAPRVTRLSGRQTGKTTLAKLINAADRLTERNELFLPDPDEPIAHHFGSGTQAPVDALYFWPDGTVTWKSERPEVSE